MKINSPKTSIRAKIRWGMIGAFALLIIAGCYDVPVYANRLIDKVNNSAHLGFPRLPEKNFNLGLDLQGGAHLVYQTNVENVKITDRATAVEGVRDVIERRVNAFGVSEPVVQTTKVGSDYRIIVELPGVTDVKKAIQMIGETPILEYTKEKAKVKADELYKQASAANFPDLAKLNSTDLGSKESGGDLGYFQKGMMTKSFEDAVFAAKVGQIIGNPPVYQVNN